MKLKTIICSISAVALLAATGCETKHLESEAKISRADAERIALEKAPGGTVKEGEFEKEDGKLVWSFDISRAGTKDITEVQVDAKSGAVVAVENESEEDEANEKEKEHQK